MSFASFPQHLLFIFCGIRNGSNIWTILYCRQCQLFLISYSTLLNCSLFVWVHCFFLGMSNIIIFDGLSLPWPWPWQLNRYGAWPRCPNRFTESTWWEFTCYLFKNILLEEINKLMEIKKMLGILDKVAEWFRGSWHGINNNTDRCMGRSVSKLPIGQERTMVAGYFPVGVTLFIVTNDGVQSYLGLFPLQCRFKLFRIGLARSEVRESMLVVLVHGIILWADHPMEVLIGLLPFCEIMSGNTATPSGKQWTAHISEQDIVVPEMI